MKILMVCLGNICRSPLAEGIMQRKIKEQGLLWHVDSAGTGGWHAGERPDSRSRAMAQQHGIDIGQQRARQVHVSDFDTFDLILAMDENNYNDLLRMAPSPAHHGKVRPILAFAHGTPADVPDPYYDDRFQLVYDLLDEACDKVLEQLMVEES
jgi:protein-tyrosine phosphatase